ncbi:hypothetical protein M8312_04600 [Sphingomonas sp. KRR8]|uniref:hypothetical protein n=1 Tax=Sphingomonas sp. KRR8 TaxID=2942996 RepID=UPI0020220EFF|nr:hypothetical protein [Sphingomonas sp. KRR8]URD61798.1 hypothetical protein M8312_04600 [Sphingomonas sp. KRR8]
MRTTFCRLLFAGTFLAPAAALAQPAPATPTTAAAPAATDDDDDFTIPSREGLVAPRLDFTATPEAEAGFDKYFFFHRANTSFEEAYADIRECDSLASGSSIYMGGDASTMAGAVAQYGMAGVVGGAIGGAIADAIFGSAARREQRRTNLRNCMSFKGYQRYGLTRDLWTAFNFEEGNGRKREPVRLHALALQALVASGPKPTSKELGL